MMVLVAVLLLCRGGTIYRRRTTIRIMMDRQRASGYLRTMRCVRRSFAAQSTANGGFGLNMWGTIVNRDGVVCAVAFTGNRGRPMAGKSRDLCAEGEYGKCIQPEGARAFDSESVYGDAAGRDALWFAVEQPGQHGRGVSRRPSDYGQSDDPMVGGRIGGINVFGGGLALYNSSEATGWRRWE